MPKRRLSESEAQGHEEPSALLLCEQLVICMNEKDKLSSDFPRWCLLQTVQLDYGSPRDLHRKLKTDVDVNFYSTQLGMFLDLIHDKPQVLHSPDASDSVFVWFCQRMLSICSNSAIPEGFRNTALNVVKDLLNTVSNPAKLDQYVLQTVNCLKDVMVQGERIFNGSQITAKILIHSQESTLHVECPPDSTLIGSPVIIQSFYAQGLTFEDCQILQAHLCKLILHCAQCLPRFSHAQLNNLMAIVFSLLNLGNFPLKTECLWLTKRLLCLHLFHGNRLVCLLDYFLTLLTYSTTFANSPHEKFIESALAPALNACLFEFGGKLVESTLKGGRHSPNGFLDLSPSVLSSSICEWLKRIGLKILSPKSIKDVQVFVPSLTEMVIALCQMCSAFVNYFKLNEKKELEEIVRDIIQVWLPIAYNTNQQELQNLVCACLKTCLVLELSCKRQDIPEVSCKRQDIPELSCKRQDIPDSTLYYAANLIERQCSGLSTDVCEICGKASAVVDALCSTYNSVTDIDKKNRVQTVIISSLARLSDLRFLSHLQSLIIKSESSINASVSALQMVQQILLVTYNISLLTAENCALLFTFTACFSNSAKNPFPKSMAVWENCVISQDVKSSSIVQSNVVKCFCCISQVDGCREVGTMRGEIVETALNSSNSIVLESVLHGFPIHLASLSPANRDFAFNERLLPLLPIISKTAELMPVYLKCIRCCICVFAGQIRIKKSRNCLIIECGVCDCAELVLSKLKVFPALERVIVSVFHNISMYSPDSKTGILNVLLAMLKHCDTEERSKSVENVTIKCLSLMLDNTHEVRLTISSLLRHISVGPFSEEMSVALQEIIFKLNPESCPENMPWSVQFLSILLHCKNAILSDICLVKLILLTTLYSADIRNVRDHLEKLCNAREISLEQLYKSCAEFMWTHVLGAMIDELMEIVKTSNETDSLSCHVKQRLMNVAQVFGFIDETNKETSFKIWLRSSIRYLYPNLIVKHCNASSKILSDIARFIDSNRFAIISDRNYFKYIFVKVLRSEKNPEPFWKYICEQGDQSDRTTIGHYVSGQFFHCASYLLLFLWENEALVLEAVEQLANDGGEGQQLANDGGEGQQLANDGGEGQQITQSFNLASFLQNRMQWQLFLFHEMFCASEPYSDRAIALCSLQIILRIIKGKLLERYRRKAVAVLMAASEMVDLRRDVVAVWVTFIKCLKEESVAELLPQMIVCTLSLHGDRLADPIFHTLFKDVKGIEKAKYFNAICSVLVGLSKYKDVQSFLPLQFIRHTDNDNSMEDMQCCITLIKDFQMKEIKALALERLVEFLDHPPWQQSSSLSSCLNAELVDLVLCLIDTLKECSDAHVQMLTLKCVGHLGAIDPGKLGLELSSPTLAGRVPRDCRPPPILYPNFGQSNGEFLRQLLSRMSVSVESMTSCFKYDRGICCIKGVLAANNLLPNENNYSMQYVGEIWDKLEENVKDTLEHARHTRFRLDKSVNPTDKLPIPIFGTPLGESFNFWITNWILYITNQLKSGVEREIFSNCAELADIDTSFAQYILPHLLLHCMLGPEPDHKIIINKISIEMNCVLGDCSNSTGQSSDMQQLAAQTVFSALDYLKRWASFPPDNTKNKDINRDRVLSFVNSFDPLLIVNAAIGCNFIARGVLTFEQSLASKPNICSEDLQRLQMFHSSMGDADGVIGALQCIKMKGKPNVQEQILALEAIGDYTESLPLHQLQASTNGNTIEQLGLIKCLLKLNQPHVVHNYILGLETFSRSPVEDKTLVSLRVEAARKLENWEDLDKLLNKNNGITDEWQMTLGRLLSGLRKGDEHLVRNELSCARKQLLAPIHVSTMEVGAYERAYKHISCLSILSEIEQASKLLWKKNENENHLIKDDIINLFKQWDARLNFAQHSPVALEPILEVRRNLMSLGTHSKCLLANFKQSCWLESAKITRKAGHLQSAWGFLVKAKEAGYLNHSKLLVEEAKLAWMKTNKEESLCLLVKNLNDNFKFSPEAPKKYVSLDGSENCTHDFSQALTLYMKYAYEAGAKTTDDMRNLYRFASEQQLDHEPLLYQMACFYDDIDTSSTSTTQPLCSPYEQVHAYLETLKYGSKHLHHSMPRLLTKWLDASKLIIDTEYYLKKFPEKSTLLIEKCEPTKRDLPRMNQEILHAFKSKRVSQAYFYSAFSQLTSRIENCEKSALAVLQYIFTIEEIIAGLMVEFPEQCLWLILGILNAAPAKSKRRLRLDEVFAMAASKSKGNKKPIGEIVHAMEKLFTLLRNVTDTRPRSHADVKLSMKSSFPDLFYYFAGGKGGGGKKPPKILAPLQALLALVPSAPVVHSDSYSSTQNTSTLLHDLAVHKVYIHSFDDCIDVLSTLQRPKKIGIRTSDGNSYKLLCKPGDDMRKDKRMIEFCRVVNSCLQEDPESRSRQLHVRTFEIIPLGAASGVVEFLENMIVMRGTIFDVMKQRGTPPNKNAMKMMADDSTSDKLAVYRLLVQGHKPALGQWFRSNFVEPCGWYAARQAFIRTTATMSMVGFIVGLGDRHSENILIDKTTGDIFHVDFNCLFNRGEHLGVPEMVPFRLTPHMVEAFGPLGVEGPFRKCSESTVAVMRQRRKMLSNVLQTFVFDPLVEWAKEGNTHNGNVPVNALINMALKGKDVLKFIQARLGGQNVTPKGMIKNQLEPKEGEGLSVQSQVTQLISIASDEKILAKMYHGWAPYL